MQWPNCHICKSLTNIVTSRALAEAQSIREKEGDEEEQDEEGGGGREREGQVIELCESGSVQTLDYQHAGRLCLS